MSSGRLKRLSLQGLIRPRLRTGIVSLEPRIRRFGSVLPAPRIQRTWIADVFARHSQRPRKIDNRLVAIARLEGRSLLYYFGDIGQEPPANPRSPAKTLCFPAQGLPLSANTPAFAKRNTHHCAHPQGRTRTVRARQTPMCRTSQRHRRISETRTWQCRSRLDEHRRPAMITFAGATSQ